MLIDHSKGFQKQISPIVARGAAGALDDYFVYAAAQGKIEGVDHIWYSGTRLINNDPKISRQCGQIMLSTFDGSNHVKQGVVIPRDFMPGIRGLSPFDYAVIDGVHYLFVTVFGHGGEIYNIGYFTSADGNFSGASPFQFVTGLSADQTHGASLVANPADASQVFLFYTQMDTAPAFVRRATLSTVDLSAAFDDIQVTDYPSIYPSVRHTGEVFEMIVAKPIGDDASNGYLNYKTASPDGAYFPKSNNIIHQRGGVGAFDEHYTTTPNFDGERLLYSGRASDNLGYRGIGQAQLADIGGVYQWDWTLAGVGYISLPNGNGHGMRLVPGSKGSPEAWIHKRGLGIYEAVIYDDMAQQNALQNTFRITDANYAGPLLGIWCGASKSRYVFRTSAHSAWQISSIDRSPGLHTLTMEVSEVDVVMKIDGITVATDTAFDTLDYFRCGFMGYWKSGVPAADLGTALVKSLSFDPI